MARPIQADAEKTRQRILDAAHRLFSENGMGKTSMREIAKASEVSLATLHHYFGNKEGLHRAASDMMYERLGALFESVGPRLARAENLAGLLEETVTGAFRFVVEHQLEARFMMRHVVDTGEIETTKRESFLVPFLDKMSAVTAELAHIPRDVARLNLLSLNHLIVRFALTSPSELVVVMGLDPSQEGAPQSQKEAVRRVEKHLVQLAHAMFHVRES